ncbi:MULTISPECIES: hypothetical protein [unclassified Endozoicomonas]|uniref:hypothetical protein n=1 Tax=unclassified Endozoicomonas TaxID=2644528 RepID=UPI0021478DA9|nr:MULTISPECIES: hypothetical protein [unclassified Endozoicomonas]
MNINTTGTDAYGLHKSSLAEKNVDGSHDSGQAKVKSFSKKRRVEDKYSTLAKQISAPGFIAPGFSHQMLNQSITERIISRSFTTEGSEFEEVAIGRMRETFTAGEVAERIQNIVENLIYSLRYHKIAREDYKDDERDEITEIFVDFILFQEGLVRDRCFTAEGSPDKYVAGQTISQMRVEEIETFLHAIFTERAEAESKLKSCRLVYSLGDILLDYLNKKENVPNDVAPVVKYFLYLKYEFTYGQLLNDIFPFFQILLSERGLFSELVLVFNFAVKFRKEIIDSADSSYPTKNLLTIALRRNRNGIREHFNRDVMDIIFSGRCDGIVNALFEGFSLPVGSEATPKNRLNLKFGEELEYDVRNSFSVPRGKLVKIFLYRLGKKELAHQVPARKFGARYGFYSNFTVVPFYDTISWFEINCTPYHSDDQLAELSFEKVIEVIDSMRKDGLIGYSSGHKHVDVLSATQGDASVLLAMESEIQRNPFLLRAFGNNARIVQYDEAEWYKTFADYNSDIKPFAVKRLNVLIDRYNRKIEEGNTEPLNQKGNTDSEKKDKLKQFAHFYSQLVHMTTIQWLFSGIGDDYMEKYIAMSLLHITGASKVKELSTLEFRFFRCPKTVQEIKLINQFLHAWFQYIHRCRKDKIPLQPVPEDIQSSKDYTAEEVKLKTIDYLRALGLNPEDYRCFWGEVRPLPSTIV